MCVLKMIDMIIFSAYMFEAGCRNQNIYWIYCLFLNPIVILVELNMLNLWQNETSKEQHYKKVEDIW